MVDHLTRVTVDGGAPRCEALAGALVALGFEVRRGRRRLEADSTVVGGREVKECLRALGFEDREYRVFVEYVRRWGVM